MTVSSSTSRVSYSGNGSLTAFAYTFKIFDEDDLTVILRASDGTETVQTITTNYTVSGVGDAGGGNVTFVTAPTATQTVVILREQPLTQGLDLVPNDPFPANSLEEALDKIVFMTQKHEEELGRAIKASRTNVITGSEFTISASDRANKVFAFDSSGDVSITQEIGTYRGDWSASVAYNVRDLVKDASNDNIYIINTAHTSSGSTPLSSNANTAYYDLIVDTATASAAQTAAAASAAAASTSETNAATSESNAATSEANAATSESNASSSASAAHTAQAAAEAALDTFDDTYLGAFASDPTVDNDGGALTDGDLYFNTTDNVMKVYDLGNTEWKQLTPTSAQQTNIDTVAGQSSEITTVSGISSDITSAASVSADITTVAGQISPTNNISTLAGISSSIANVASIYTDVSTVATYTNEINTIGDDLTAGSFVAGSQYDFGSVADATSGTSGSPDGFIVTVFNSLTDITSVAGVASDVSSLAPQASNISTLAGISADITTAATNVTDITNFADVYIGGASSNPTTRTDGSSLQTGDLFFNSTSNELRVYNGSAWQGGVTASAGLLTASNNLSDVSSAATSRTNLGLGSAATSDTGDFAAAVHNHDADYAALSHTHTLSDITDSGTMASQNANNVNITGGIIDGGSIV